ncbi:hypothetical protein LTR10_017378 [Elasticomyces elasticus]|uniref:Uncharacterized protein n=1 Tax=Exophiala sideris TaxID=1016849 RepID=A0ABR0J9D6_9EURO|nr:hypothetical protein LTR10_017378 [Elasticomyces elasticus]KAK5027866.1 hypothetical protein LTS07_006741 [Exophiala sideris]KAK5037544.1 hypothetical protein LTR13_004702 [Exophiala sideris]KAK5059205.1 hypothetical protein LTR69_006495 [Exophiala sideris]KAK5183040.1 hypothetical protein LTR44_004751 [Eurotiomycetes sp. CCFEE 6388]
MTGKVESEKLGTDTELQKKSPLPTGGARQVENVAKPIPATTKSKEDSGASSPATLTGLAKLDAHTFNTWTHGDSRRRIDVPPRLPFDLRQHKLSIAIFTFLAYAECCFIPLGLYYGLSKGTSMRSGLYFAIITSLFGSVSGYEFAMRSWRIMRYGEDYRPLYGSQYFRGFDATQYVLLTPFTIMTIIQVVFSCPRYPSVKALALPMPVGLIVLGGIFVVNGVAAQRGWRLMHTRLSSHVRNTVCPPLTFVFLEDVCAVDGQGGKRYRKAAMARYHASPHFRAMLMKLQWFWAVSAIVVGAAVIALIWVVREDVAYGVGWGVPSLWTAVGTWLTVVWVQRELRIEKVTWMSHRINSA